MLNGGRDDYGFLELAQVINQRYIDSPPGSEAVFQRLWAQTLLAVWSRREGHVPTLLTPEDLEGALQQALDILPLLHEGFEVIFGDQNLAVRVLTRLIPRFVAGMRAQPSGLPDFAASVVALAALPKPVNRQVQPAPPAPAPPMITEPAEGWPKIVPPQGVHTRGAWISDQLRADSPWTATCASWLNPALLKRRGNGRSTTWSVLIQAPIRAYRDGGWQLIGESNDPLVVLTTSGRPGVSVFYCICLKGKGGGELSADIWHLIEVRPDGLLGNVAAKGRP
ncbi:hypothetical protein EHF33_19990 (plasmid) [Deinococcus psychrotolerans]|uniref:Uncharacterized protein n=1 Tax=Deinococcus psychrotolerans TaxID=2489213 RepID=A0A3G8YVH2_9DEIO|nr:hypothetical protein [Deinococcus psychrotolerans]AZI45196.1 hypothetical protein EHF33_19990 [Deinococcus psychrotolerans]